MYAYRINGTIATNSTTVEIPPLENYYEFDYFYEAFFTYIVPIICAFGMVTNILNIIVFNDKEMKDETYKYLRMNAFSNFFYLLIVFFVFSKRCGRHCELENTFIVEYYYWIFYIYAKGIFAIFTVCIQILVSLLRLFIVTNKKFCKIPSYKVTTVILVIFAAIFYSPNGFTKRVAVRNTLVAGTNDTYVVSYALTNNAIGNSAFGKTLIIVTTIIRGYICGLIIIVINILSKLALNKHMEKKSKMKSGGNKAKTETNVEASKTENQDASTTEAAKPAKTVLSKEEKASRNLTLMVMAVCILYLMGNVPNSLAWVIVQFVPRSAFYTKILIIVANILLFTSQGMDIFVYYKFNKKYKTILRKLLKLSAKS